eukprot:scaffold82095_cov29-Tisochrysis_lutea.AAC.3
MNRCPIIDANALWHQKITRSDAGSSGYSYLSLDEHCLKCARLAFGGRGLGLKSLFSSKQLDLRVRGLRLPLALQLGTPLSLLEQLFARICCLLCGHFARLAQGCLQLLALRSSPAARHRLSRLCGTDLAQGLGELALGDSARALSRSCDRRGSGDCTACGGVMVPSEPRLLVCFVPRLNLLPRQPVDLVCSLKSREPRVHSATLSLSPSLPLSLSPSLPLSPSPSPPLSGWAGPA